MAKKKASIGTITFYKETPKKRPGRHSKNYNKRSVKRKQYRGQGR
jgi:hypothetical protein